ncbi:MAG: SET domain-containing protein [Candidatus Woesearchaeota archaeon]
MDVEIRDSKINGKGVFALKDFKKGEIVIKWDLSKVLTDKEVTNLSEDEKKYLDFTNGKHVLQQPPARYVNHSCNPNTSVEIIKFCDVAIKDIKKEEEITSDYSTQLSEGIKFKCNCGDKDCRKIIKRS